MNYDTLRIPPQNLDAERSVLGSLMFMNSAIDEIDLRADEFYTEHHQTFFATFSKMWQSGCRTIDAVTIAEELATRDELENIGGPAYIAEIVEAVPHAAHVRHYARIVREKAQQRQLIYACSETLQKAHNDEAGDLVSELESKLLNIREAGSGADIATMADAVDALEEMESDPSAIHSTGLVDLDRRLNGGFRDGQFIIVGGRPGSGKSVLSGQIGATFAKRNEPALIVSLEMSRAELAERYDKSIDRQQLRGLPIYIVDSACEADRIAGLIRLARRKHGIRLAVLDYLQLTETSDRKASRERQIAEVSRICKRLAMELKIPIVAATQLNRSCDREQRPPRLSDLRESGAIEQDADIVLLLNRGEDDSVKIITAKHRGGGTGVVPVNFRPEVFRFENSALFTGGF